MESVCCLLQEFGQFYLGKSSNYEAGTSDELLKGWSLTSCQLVSSDLFPLTSPV